MTNRGRSLNSPSCVCRLSFFLGDKLNERQVVYNNKFIPEIEIYRLSESNAKTDCGFPVEKVLLSMSFTLSINDITGSFSITLFPEVLNSSGDEYVSVFDSVKIMDIVEIREQCFSNEKKTVESKPVFTGVVRTKKFITQTDGNGGVRRVSISGMAVTGLVSQFKINLDTSAMALTKKLQEQGNLNTELTVSFLGEKNLKVSAVVKKVWEHFLAISEQNGTPRIADYIEATMGGADTMFAYDDTTFYYPLGCIFKGEQTQDFFSLIDGIVPSPIYEKFAFMGSDGKMKIMIRQVPFDSDKWSGDAKSRESGKGNAKRVSFDTVLLKSFELSQSDKDVYTIFYAYLSGYPTDEQKSLRLSTIEESIDDTLKSSDEYKTYGYKPLICHFIGYGIKDGEKDSDSAKNIKDMTEKLKGWFENTHKMLSGSMTLAMTYQNDTVIMPGDVLLFLKDKDTPDQKHWAEFYVEGITHSWNYGQGGEINLTVSRGGKYKSGVFQAADTEKMEVGKLSVLMESIQK